MKSASPIVAGAVVLYECDVDIADNLATYADDLDVLIVVDNSARPTPAVEAIVAAHRRADYVFNNANLGIAAALNQAVECARAHGADFLLTMDQDSGFDEVPFCIFRKRVLELPFLPDLAVAAPSFLEGTPQADAVAVDSETIITSGSIVHLTNHARIGPFDEKLFIDEVDHDYCLRARDAGLRVVTLPAVRLRHRLGQARTVSVLGKAVRWNVHSPSRHYYMVRNGLYMFAKHRRNHLGYAIGRLGRLTRTIVAALLLAPRRQERFGMVMRGVRDYWTGRMGARDDRGYPATIRRAP